MVLGGIEKGEQMEGLSVRETTVARAFAGRAGRVLAATLFLLAIAMAAPMLAQAANPAANIDQCRNGQITAPVQCIDNAWQNGNLGPENSHYREGDSVPFRAVLTDLDASAGNTHTLVIQYDTLQSGKHAYDYLTSFDATETNADPVHDISGTTAGNCFTIPVDLTNLFANPGSTQEPGCIQIYNGTITSVVYGSADATGQRSVIVNFTATNPTVVIAWGGHIASQIDWGAGNSASAISGSPYHMRLLTLDDTQLGNQDRSLKASGILPIPAVFTTQAEFGQITEGGSVTDTATLTGSNGPVTGTVKFFVCGPDANSNPDCTSGGTQVGGSVTISGGQAISAAFMPGTATGHYCFRAEYTPDAFAPYSPSNHTDTTQECFTVTAGTAINTDAGGPYTIGADGTVALSDTATLSGGRSDATGTITFQLFSDDNCQTQVGSDQTVTVDKGADDQSYVSPTILVSAAGTYHWIASFASDDTNTTSNATSICGAPGENPVVNLRPTELTTNAGGPFVLGADGTVALSDTATLSGGTSGAGGTITFMLFSDSACSTQVGGDVTAAVDGADGQQYPSPSITVNAPGTYYWIAIYSGDTTQNAGSSTTCGDENETPLVIKPHISISKSPDAQTILLGQTASFTITVTNDGDATLTNVVVTDALAPGCARTSADIPGLASMAAGASVSYTCSLANVTSSFTNIAVATGTPPVGPVVTAQDTADVTAVAPATHPAITIVKNPKSQTVTVGKTATFTITVTNTGDVALTNVTVTDALSPNCNRTIGTLAPGASSSYTCTRANVTANFTNVAVASGTAGGTTVTAQDTAPVTAKAALKPKTVKKVKPKVVSHRKPKATG
jgi:uncharacterized repeat protein (TIGR01451 family)